MVNAVAVAVMVVEIAEVALMAAVADDLVADRVVMVAGATGLVGRAVLAALLADKRYRAIHTLGRRAAHPPHGRLTHHAVADFTRLPPLPAVNDVFIALGTTIKVAGSRAAFSAVDHDAVLAIANAAHKAGATRLAVVSAMGADPASRVFYSRVKGETEAALQAIGYATLVIARPSMLAGDRGALAQPPRLGERVGLALMGVLKPMIPRNYQAVQAADVARAMVRAMAADRIGDHILLSGQMQA